MRASRFFHLVLAALARHKATAVEFVKESRLQVAGERDERVGILQRWTDAVQLLASIPFL